MLALLLALLVCEPSAADPVADALPMLVGVSAPVVAFAGRTLVEAETGWLMETLTALPLALPATHLTTSSLCSRK